ncbi:MAG: adenine nucleotide alpha hydrolase [Gammaproteobacteria bacterium]|nr:adenine nucleotide alpha hydrolase [Gammaproteobacteria bacterium]
MIKLARLKTVLEQTGPVAVAVSGGVDSMTLAVVAHHANRESQMFHALSPAVPERATQRVKNYADKEGWNLYLIDAGEIRDPKYLANPVNRCYFCKTNLYDTICENTDLVVISGTNMDDLGDYRPGLVAADEHAVRHPYVEAGISKSEVRDIARSLGLSDLQDLPAAPCLSSRVMTGIAIDEKLLPIINEVEESLWQSLQLYIPIRGVRCRIRPDEVAIEIDTQEDVDATSAYAREAIGIVTTLFEKHGYQEYLQTVSIEPYKRGSAFLIETLPID